MSAEKSHQHVAWIGTLVVAANAAFLTVHTIAHFQLDILLGPLANLYVVVVIIIAPILAVVLLWTGPQRPAACLLFFSMLGSFLFGGYHHFIADSRDHVAQVPASAWGTAFIVSAVAMAVIELAGCAVGLWAASASREPAVQ